MFDLQQQSVSTQRMSWLLLPLSLLFQKDIDADEGRRWLKMMCINGPCKPCKVTKGSGCSRVSTLSNEYPNVGSERWSPKSLPCLKYQSVDLVTAGQATRWFDTKLLWSEIQRILKKAVLWPFEDTEISCNPVMATCSQILNISTPCLR